MLLDDPEDLRIVSHMAHRVKSECQSLPGALFGFCSFSFFLLCALTNND